MYLIKVRQCELRTRNCLKFWLFLTKNIFCSHPSCIYNDLQMADSVVSFTQEKAIVRIATRHRLATEASSASKRDRERERKKELKELINS